VKHSIIHHTTHPDNSPETQRITHTGIDTATRPFTASVNHRIIHTGIDPATHSIVDPAFDRVIWVVIFQICHFFKLEQVVYRDQSGADFSILNDGTYENSISNNSMIYFDETYSKD
jgi:hypothetical protein